MLALLGPALRRLAPRGLTARTGWREATCSQRLPAGLERPARMGAAAHAGAAVPAPLKALAPSAALASSAATGAPAPAAQAWGGWLGALEAAAAEAPDPAGAAPGPAMDQQAPGAALVKVRRGAAVRSSVALAQAPRRRHRTPAAQGPDPPVGPPPRMPCSSRRAPPRPARARDCRQRPASPAGRAAQAKGQPTSPAVPPRSALHPGPGAMQVPWGPASRKAQLRPGAAVDVT